MRVLVDTSIWSLALRRRRGDLSRHERSAVHMLTELIREGRTVLIGPVRQELLSGISEGAVFDRLAEHLRWFPDELLTEADFEEAARCDNRCRRAGVVGSSTDFLICAVALRRDIPVFTSDADFVRYASPLSLRLVAGAGSA